MKPIGFTVASRDDFWQEKAYELKNNLSTQGIELVIHTIDIGQCDDYSLMRHYYLMKDRAFIDFASQTQRRVWLLDAEIRLIAPIPKEWIDSDSSVIFFKDIPYRHKDDKMCFIDTGESIFDSAGKDAYKRAVDIAFDAAGNSSYYDVEAFLHTTLTSSYIKEKIGMDRMLSDGYPRASRGRWYELNSVLIHPYDHNWKTSQKFVERNMEIYRLSRKDFLNHFSPGDKILAYMINDLLKAEISMDQRWLSLPISRFAEGGYVKQLCDMLPSSLPRMYSKLKYPCYLIADWIICPTLKLLADSKEWNQRAYFLD